MVKIFSIFKTVVQSNNHFILIVCCENIFKHNNTSKKLFKIPKFRRKLTTNFLNFL